MSASSIISKIRDQHPLLNDEISWFAQGLANGHVTDAQAGAFAMAALLNGMADHERVALTLAMRDSGDVMSWNLPGPIIDKHSTGGLGDCVSLLLAPALAAVGAYNPMISGRGLGHTGGTLDKLEAIPNLSTEVTSTQFKAMTKNIGCAIVSATQNIAPADKRLYAIRDVTATIESIDLITASILSKKLAAGLDALVLDVKCGSGAFMRELQDAQTLSESLVQTANLAGCKASALITDMNQPLCPALGNATEMRIIMETLTQGQTQSRLCDVTCALGAELLVLSGLFNEHKTARNALENTIKNGTAAEKFAQMVAALGGPHDILEKWATYLPQANVVRTILAKKEGIIEAIDGIALGNAVVKLGAGRLKETDRVDPSVGISECCALGDHVEKESILAVIHAKTHDDADTAQERLHSAIKIGKKPLTSESLIIKKVT